MTTASMLVPGVLALAVMTAGCTWVECPQGWQGSTGGTNGGPPATGGTSSGGPGQPGCLADTQTMAPLEEPSEACEDTSDAVQNVADRGCVTRGSLADAGSAVLAFDDNSGTKWVSNDPQDWLAYDFPGDEAHVVATYRITVAGDTDDRSADPTAWELQGTNEAGEPADDAWTTLDRRMGEGFTSAYQRRTYSVENDVAYQRYRFLVLDNGGAERVELAELELFPSGTPLFSIDSAIQGDGDHQFDYSDGFWGHTLETASDRYHGSSSWSPAPGEYFEVDFVGTQVLLYGIVDPKHGIMGVSIDGGEEVDVDLYGPAQNNALVYTSPKLCPGRHTLRGSVTGRRNAQSSDLYISLDRVLVVP